MRQENFDSLDIMTDEQKRDFFLVKQIKQNIKHFIPKDELLEFIEDIMDKNEYFIFSEKNKKYINMNRPLLIIKPNIKRINKDYKLKYVNEDQSTYYIDNRINPIYKDDINYLQDLVHEVLIVPISNFIMSYINDEQKFLQVLKNNGLNIDDEFNIEMSKMIKMTSSIMTSIRVDLMNNKIFIEMIL